MLDAQWGCVMLVAEVRVKKVKSGPRIVKQEVVLSPSRGDGILSKPRGEGASTMALEDEAFVDMVRKAMETHQRYIEKQCIDANLSSVEWVPCEK